MYRIIVDKTNPNPSPLEARLLRAAALKSLGYKIITEKEEKEKPLYIYTITTINSDRYTVKFDSQGFSCTCPDTKFGASAADGWCKHKLLILTRINLPAAMAVALLTYPQLAPYIRKVARRRKK